MSRRGKIFKSGCGDSEGCKIYPTFKVSSCPLGPPVSQGEPEPPPPAFAPVYGSLYVTAFRNAVTGTNVDFDTVGPSSGVTLDTADDSITVNSTGVYTISFSTQVAIGEPGNNPQSVTFSLSINGTPDPTKQIIYQTLTGSVNDFDTLSRTDQLMLNQGDVIRIFITFASASMFYNDSALVVTKVA